VEDVSTFTAPAHTNSRVDDDDTGQVEGGAKKKVIASYNDMFEWFVFQSH
jgi:hypothetical protein